MYDLNTFLTIKNSPTCSSRLQFQSELVDETLKLGENVELLLSAQLLQPSLSSVKGLVEDKVLCEQSVVKYYFRINLSIINSSKRNIGFL